MIADITSKTSLRFFVAGVPAPGGSKVSMVTPGTGRLYTKEDCKRNPAWRQDVAIAAMRAMVGRGPMTGPLKVRFYFSFPRPKGHYRTGRNAGEVKDSAPIYHIVKPDTTKLIRAAEDACTGIVWRDDAQIIVQSAEKVYTLARPGLSIDVEELQP